MILKYIKLKLQSQVNFCVGRLRSVTICVYIKCAHIDKTNSKTLKYNYQYIFSTFYRSKYAAFPGDDKRNDTTKLSSLVTPYCFVFLNKVPSIRLNTTYRSRTMVFYYTLRHVSAVQINHHQVDVGYTKRNLNGEMPHFTVL